MSQTQNDRLEQNKDQEPMSHMARVTATGFFGGLFWSLMGYIAYYFNFTDVGPAIVLNPIALGDWKNEGLGQAISIIIIAIISIGIAILYNIMLQKVEKIWVSMLFGAALWGVVFYLLNPIFPGLEPVTKLGMNTIITTICLYILYGTFIGYSVSYDANAGSRQVQYSNE
jgi:hypothetical protein